MCALVGVSPVQGIFLLPTPSSIRLIFRICWKLGRICQFKNAPFGQNRQPVLAGKLCRTVSCKATVAVQHIFHRSLEL